MPVLMWSTNVSIQGSILIKLMERKYKFEGNKRPKHVSSESISIKRRNLPNLAEIENDLNVSEHKNTRETPSTCHGKFSQYISINTLFCSVFKLDFCSWMSMGFKCHTTVFCQKFSL